MNAALGVAGLSLGLGACLLAVVTLVYALVRGQRHLLRLSGLYAAVVAFSAVLAFGAMERALITRDFSMAYVVQVGSTKTPPLFNVAALWSSLEGSILLWALVLSGYLAVVAFHFRARLT